MIRLIREESDCIQKPGWTHSYRETLKQDEKNSKSDAESSSQVKLQVAYFGGLMKKVAGKLVATDQKSGTVDLSESETWSFHEDEVTQNSHRKLQQFRKLGKSWSWKKGMAIQSYRRASHVSVFSIVRKIYEREPTDNMEDLDVNVALWSIFLNTTLQAAVHLGQDYEVNPRFVKIHHLWKTVKQLLKETEKMIRIRQKVTGVTTIDYKELTLRSTSLLCNRAWQRTKRSVCSVTMHVHARWCSAPHTACGARHTCTLRGHFGSRRLLLFCGSRQRKMDMVEHGSRSAVLNGLPVHVPAVSPRELTGTTALKRGIPPGARGGIQILGMVSALTAVVDVAAFSNAEKQELVALVQSRQASWRR